MRGRRGRYEREGRRGRYEREGRRGRYEREGGGEGMREREEGKV